MKPYGYGASLGDFGYMMGKTHPDNYGRYACGGYLQPACGPGNCLYDECATPCTSLGHGVPPTLPPCSCCNKCRKGFCAFTDPFRPTESLVGLCENCAECERGMQ